MINTEEIEKTVKSFSVNGAFDTALPYADGSAHESYLIKTQSGQQYILQKLNQSVYKKRMELMENVALVTRFLQQEIAKCGGDAKRETLTLIPTRIGRLAYIDIKNQIWRMFLLVNESIPVPEPPTIFSVTAGGYAYGRMVLLLAGAPIEQLKEILPDYHNTALRLKRLKEAIKENPCRRAARVRHETDFALVRAEDAGELMDLQKRGILPTRITHNDPRMSHILLDKKNREGLCVTDLDKVMPGLSAYDFGEGVRACANSSSEDETNLEHVFFRTEMFEAFAAGYFNGAGKTFTREEYEAMPYGVKLMTYEMGMRYLTDYLLGDSCFRVKYPEQNLDRARNTFKLLQDIERKWGAICSVVDKKQQEAFRPKSYYRSFY